MKLSLFAGAVLLLASSAALAGPPKYPWCAKMDRMAQADVGDEGKFKYNNDADDTADDWGLYSIAVASCGGTSSDASEFDKPLTEARHRWEKRLGLTDRDWADVIAWTNQPQVERMDPADVDLSLEKQAIETLSPGQQYVLVTRARIKGGVSGGDSLYWADALGGAISASGRLGSIVKCVASNNPVAWAACQADIDAFDPKAVFAEMAAEKELSPDVRIQIRIVAERMARVKLPAHKAAIEKLIKSDGGYKKMFEIAAQTTADWTKLYAANDPAVALALRLDDARVLNSRKAYDGCEPVTRKELQTAISEIPAKRFSKVKDHPNDQKFFIDEALPIVLSYPRVYLSTLAFVECAEEAREANGDWAGVLDGMLIRWAGERGPRDGAISAITAAGIQLDDRDAEVKAPDIDREWLRVRVGSGVIEPDGKVRADKQPKGKRGRAGYGVIAKVSNEKEFVDVDFVAVPGTEEACASGAFTNQIEAIRSDGTIQRHYNCTKWKMMKTNQASPNAAAELDWAGSLRGGMAVSITHGVVDAAWTSPKSDVPAIVFGAPVK
ncbi:MAG TPA: hypothetical protein VGM88_32585 [Kofleriaceae bacterium]|jgi:hypothetical protein